MNRAAREDLVRVVELDGAEWLHFSPLRPDVAIIRGTSADARGNVSMEHEAARSAPSIWHSPRAMPAAW